MTELEMIKKLPEMHQQQSKLKKDFHKLSIEVKKKVKIFLKNGISNSGNNGRKTK